MGDVRLPDVNVTMIDEDRLFVDSVLRYCARLDPPLIVTGLVDVGTATDHLGRAAPEVVLLDPDQVDDPVRLVTAICSAHPGTWVVAVTMSTDSALAAAMAHAGALGWVGKDEPVSALVDTIRAVCGGAARYPAHHLAAVLQMLAADARSQRAAPRSCRTLSTREHEILSHILKGASSRDIARELHLSASTVRSHRRRIGAKLGVGF